MGWAIASGGVRSHRISQCWPSGRDRDRPAPLPAAQQKAEHDGHVHQVPGDPVQEGHLVGSGHIVDPPRHPATQRHPDDGCHDDKTDPRPRLFRGQVFPDDQGVEGDDTPLA